MSITLTDDQQAKLDQFEHDADNANKALTANRDAQARLVSDQADAINAANDATTTHAKALESAQAFIDAMINPEPAPSPSSPSSASS